MGKDVVTVCLDPVDPANVRRALAAALAPFDYDADDVRAGEWDWWHIGGGNADRGFRVLAGHEEDPRIIRNPVHVNGKARQLFPGYCDGGPRGLLDFETDRIAARERAEFNWNVLTRLAGEHAPAQPLRTFSDRCAESADYTVARAHRDHAEQPFVRAVMSAGGYDETHTVHMSIDDPVEWLHLGREKFVRNAVAKVIPTGTLLTQDGEWLDDWIVGTVEEGWEHRLRYRIFVDDYLSQLDNETMVVRVLYHS